jgi:hypothetical protein
MPQGKLRLEIMDVFGKPIGENADVFLTNQTLSDAPAFRNLDVTNPVSITGLNVFPNGMYRIEVDASSYHTVSRFVSIPADGNGEVAITLPINPKKVIAVEFPDYSAILQDARDLLSRSNNLISFVGKSGEELYNSLDDLRKAGFLNLVAKSDRTRFVNAAENPRSVLSFISELKELRGDRFLALVPNELRSDTINSVGAGLFHSADESLHTPPPGFVRAKSFKTFDHFGNLQLSFFSSADGLFEVDMDIDDAQGFDHLFQVVGNFFGGPTHPYNIHEILVASQELDPGYRLILRTGAVHPNIQAAAAKGGST